MESVYYDFTRICRTCKNESTEMQQLFTNNTEGAKECPRIDEMLMACASVQVNLADGLPNCICPACVLQLQNAFNFKIQCERSDVSLREYVKNVKETHTIKQEDEVNDAEFVNNIMGEINSAVNEIAKEKQSEGTLKDEYEPQVEGEDKEKWDYIDLLENDVMLLTCRICLKVFTTLDGLKCHKRIHTGALFKCKQCVKEYTRMKHLQRHELSHGRRKVHICKICNKTLTRVEHLKRHLVTHLKEKPFGCPTCNRGFNRSEHLANHLTRCKGETVYICDICNKAFNREDSLEVHRRLHENKMPILLTLDNLDNIDEYYIEIDVDDKETLPENSEGEEMEETDIFDQQMDSTVNFTESITENMTEDILVKVEQEKPSEVVEYNTDVYAEEDPEDMLEEKVKIEEETYKEIEETQENFEEFQDVVGHDSDSNHSEDLPMKPSLKIKRGRGRPRKHPIISKSPGRPRGRPPSVKVKSEPEDDEIGLLDKHAQAHEDLKILSCPTCQKKFTRLNHLNRHMLSHSEIKPFSCQICKKCFNRRDYLQQHMKLHTRSKEKKFQCKTCEKVFISESHLAQHMKFHNDSSKKFLCSECGQRFIRNDYLVIHMRRHRGEKPFKCKYCGKGFPRTTDLTVHERYHTGEKTHLCVICGRGFGRAYDLTVHMRTHTGERPYRCTYCDSAFAQSNDLKAHVRKHTGERFQCELCPETFLLGYLLTQHKRVVHGLNVVSNIRRLQTINKLNNLDEPAPITIPLPTPVVPQAVLETQLQAHIDV